MILFFLVLGVGFMWSNQSRCGRAEWQVSDHDGCKSQRLVAPPLLHRVWRRTCWWFARSQGRLPGCCNWCTQEKYWCLCGWGMDMVDGRKSWIFQMAAGNDWHFWFKSWHEIGGHFWCFDRFFVAPLWWCDTQQSLTEMSQNSVILTMTPTTDRHSLNGVGGWGLLNLGLIF